MRKMMKMMTALFLQLLVKHKYFPRALLHGEVSEQLQWSDITDGAFTDDFGESSGYGAVHRILRRGNDEVGGDGGTIKECADLPLRLDHGHAIHIRLGAIVGHRQHHYGENILVIVVLHHLHTFKRSIAVHPLHKHLQFCLVIVEALGTSGQRGEQECKTNQKFFH